MTLLLKAASDCGVPLTAGARQRTLPGMRISYAGRWLEARTISIDCRDSRRSEVVLDEKQQLVVAAGTEVLMKAVAGLWADRLLQLPEEQRDPVLKNLVRGFGTPGPTGPMRESEAEAFRAMSALMPAIASRLEVAIRRLLEKPAGS